MEKLTDKEIELKIEERMAEWSLPFDASKRVEAKNKLMAMARDSQSKVIPMNKPRSTSWIRVAAALAFLVALPVTLYLFASVQFVNTNDTAVIHALPDGSKVKLNPNSQVQYNQLSWSINRALTFDGEAFFDVIPGSSFTVNTNQGEVRVVGTTFTVWADENDLLVHCASGKVNVSSENQTESLLAGEMVRHNGNMLNPKQAYDYKGFIAPRKEPSVLSYDAVPLDVVLHELELVLNTEIDCNLQTSQLVYSGNLDPAQKGKCLQVLCKPFDAKHDLNPDGSVLIYD